MTAPLLAALALGLAALCGTAVARAARPARREPPRIELPRETSPEAVALRLCRKLAVALTEGRTARETHTEGPGYRLQVEPGTMNGETVWQVRVGTAVRHLCPDLHAVELAVAHEIRSWRRPAGSVDCRGGAA